MTIKGSLHGAYPIVKRFLAKKFLSSVKIGPKYSGLGEYVGLNICYFLFSNPEKGTSLRGTASFDIFFVKIGSRASAVAR